MIGRIRRQASDSKLTGTRDSTTSPMKVKVSATPTSSRSHSPSPSLQRKSSDNEIKVLNVSHAVMSSSVLSSSLVVPPASGSNNQSPSSPKEVSTDLNQQNKEAAESCGNIPQNIEQREIINGCHDNISRSSESCKSFDSSNISISQRSYDYRIDNDKTGGRSSSGETKGTVSSTKSTEKKKKSTAWYNVLSPNYKSRTEDFKKIFKDLPESERLIVDYSCAMQKDLIVHGRLYLSQNYICFYANIFRWETILMLKCKDVTSMTKERTARLIPNAIQICTDTEKHFFTSFGARDKTYLMLFRVWQNALLEQPMTMQELWQWVHYSYGEELGLTSDDDDYIAPSTQLDLDVDKVDGGHDSCHLLADEQDNSPNVTSCIDEADELDASSKHQKVVDTSMCSETNNSTVESVESHLLAGGSLKNVSPHSSQVGAIGSLSKRLAKRNTSKIDEENEECPTDMSDSTDNNEPEAEIPCPCSVHEGKEAVNEVFCFNVDQMFNMLFTESKFLMDLFKSRKIFDIVSSAWNESDQQPNKMRQLTYTVSLNNPMSPKTAQTTETQTLIESTPEQLYIVRCDVVSTGIPYGDSFSCYANYCITKVNSKKCRLKVYIGVTYKKSVFGLVKGFIDKNALANMMDYFNDLRESFIRETGSLREIPKPKKSRRRRRVKMSEVKAEFPPDVVPNTLIHPSVRRAGSVMSQIESAAVSSNISESFMKMVFAVLLLLLFLNFMLFYKLWVLEEQTSLFMSLPASRYVDFNQLSFEGKLPNTNEEWLKILQKQEILNNLEREKWKSLITDVIKLIQTTETSLSQLYESIQTSRKTVPTSSSSSSNGESNIFASDSKTDRLNERTS